MSSVCTTKGEQTGEHTSSSQNIRKLSRIQVNIYNRKRYSEEERSMLSEFSANGSVGWVEIGITLCAKRAKQKQKRDASASMH